MGRALTQAQLRARRLAEEEAQDRKWAKQDAREEAKRAKEEERQSRQQLNNRFKVNEYETFKDTLLGFHTNNIIERASLKNFTFPSSLKKPEKQNINTDSQKDIKEYIPDQSLVKKRDRLKKWSKSSYDAWCKKEGISSSLLSSILSNTVAIILFILNY